MTHLQILQCMLHAHLVNIGHLGLFNIELNKLLKENGLHEMKFPDNPPSRDILRISKMFPKTSAEEPPAEAMEDEMVLPVPVGKIKSLEKKWEN